MASTQYQIYLTSVLALAKTMVIKIEAVADAINNALILQGNVSGDPRYAVNTADPSTWKYYLNMAGQYHASDTMMAVISQDTLQTINFTLENLREHTATAAAYQPGTRYYAELVAKYPAQEMLIRGILNPVPVASALAAEDGEVLWYDPSKVESNEMSLIPEISAWVKHYQRRWFNPAYTNVDDLYLAAHLSVLYCHLPNVILGLRLKYCHTHQTHSFHIRQFLANHGGLDVFVDYLTKPQQLWLYRNIRYIQRNAGTQATFQWLVDNILTPRGIPLSDWTMRHDTSSLLSTLKPTVQFTRGEVNLSNGDTGAQVRSVHEMLLAEAGVARGNVDVDGTEPDVTRAMTLSMNDRLQTKVLESSLLDLTDAAPYRLADCLLNHWLYFATLGQYQAVVSMENPTTGEIYTVSAAEAFVIFIYATAASMNMPLAAIPPLYAFKVRKQVTPTRAELRAIVDMSVVDESDLDAIYAHLPLLARNYLSIESFNTMVQAIHADELYQHALFSTQGHLWKRAYLEQATLYFYTDIECDLWKGEDYATWFKDRGLNIPSMSNEDLGVMAGKMLDAATGQNLATVTSLADLQAALLRLMARLSSYSVQYLASINTSPIIVMERPSARVGEIYGEAEQLEKVTIPLAELYDFGAGGAASLDHTHPNDVSMHDVQVHAEVTVEVDLSVRLQDNIEVTTIERIKSPRVGLQGFSDNLDTSLKPALIATVADYQPTGLKSLPEAFSTLAMGFYGPLSDADKATLQARYTAYLQANGYPVPSLSDTIGVTQLDIIDVTYPDASA